MKKLIQDCVGAKCFLRILSVLLVLCMMLSTVSLRVILAEGQPEVSRGSLIPSSVVISDPTALQNISLPQSEYGSLSWENGSAVPSSYQSSYPVIFKSNGKTDLSKIEGYDAGSGTLKGSVQVVVKNLAPTPTAAPEQTPAVTETPTVEPTQAPDPEVSGEDQSGTADNSAGQDDSNKDDMDKNDSGESGTDKEDAGESETGKDDGKNDAGENGSGDADESETGKDDSKNDAGENGSGDADESETGKDDGKNDAGENGSGDADESETGKDDGKNDPGESGADKEDVGKDTEVQPGINDITDQDLEDTSKDQPKTVDPEAVPQDQATVATQNHTCNGINISADFLPWYVQFRVTSGDGYEFSNEESANVFQSYELELWDLMNDQPYEIPEGKYVTVSIPVKEGYEYTIEHLLSDGSSETIIPTVYGGTMVFSVNSFSPFGIAGSKPLVGDEIAENGYDGSTVTPKPTQKPSTSNSDESENSSTTSTPKAQRENTGSTVNNNSSNVERTVTYQNTTTKPVQTGDTTAILPFVIMAVAGLAAIAAIIIIVLVVNRKRRK